MHTQKYFWSILILLAAGFFAGGCKPSLAPSKPLNELTAEESGGQRLFATRCGGCHKADSTAALHGPGLFGLYRKRYLPSGAPANDDRVTAVIQHGRGMMPAEGNSMNDEQLRALLAYLHTL